MTTTTTTTTSIAESAQPAAPASPDPRAPVAGRQAAGIDGRAVRRRAVSVALLALCVLGALLAVPDLRPVARAIEDMNPALVAAAVAFEVASCVSFVAIFRRFFESLSARAAHELAWAQMGSGALLPGGGVGSVAVGGWLLHLVGMPTRHIVRRSSALFFLTSAINVLLLGGAGLALALGIAHGPHDLLLTGLPVIVAVGAIGLVLGVSIVAPRLSGGRSLPAWLDDVGVGIPAARDELTHPGWRLLGAVGYLLFDIAVLWVAFGAVGPLPPLAPLIVAYLAGYLANAIPIPGGIGVLDAGLVGALALYGLPVTHAAAAVLVYHAIAFWIPTLGGTIAYVSLRRRL